jgi:uncharacterized protein YndB with AHSA1/START domain
MIKKILLVLLTLFALLIVAVGIGTAVAPTVCNIEREVTINRPKADVFNYVRYLKNQNTWGPWAKRDPQMKQEFRGSDGNVGFVTTWKSENGDLGSGEQEIMKVVDGERIETQIRFKEPFENKGDAYMTTEETGPGATKVKWGMKVDFPRPMNVMLLVMDMDKMMGADLEEGLSSLKTIMEAPPTVN